LTTLRPVWNEEAIMANIEIKRRDAKTGSKRDKDVRKLSASELQGGEWSRGMAGNAHHFFIGGTSVCGRPQPDKVVADLRRKLCPECWTAVARARGQGGMDL